MQRDGGPGGAGGAGNPTGGSFTGGSDALEILQDFAYAYSGLTAVDNNLNELLSFTTGNFLFVGILQYAADGETGDNFMSIVKLNGAIVHKSLADRTTQDYVTFGVQGINLIIPSYTEVLFTLQNVSTTASISWTPTLTGRIYRG